MEIFELKKEQTKLAGRIILRDGFDKVRIIAGAECIAVGNKILASVVVCEFPSFKVLEHQTYLLSDPLPYHPEYVAYREMPALVEAYNKIELEPDVILVSGSGINHPRKIGIASHLGLILNKSTIGITDKLELGRVEHGKIMIGLDLAGFEIKTREHANPIYVSPGHLITPGAALELVSKSIVYPHKMPEPLHLAHKLGKKKSKE